MSIEETTKPQARFDDDRIAAAICEILGAIGEDPSREGLQETPARVAAMYEEIFSGLGRDPREVLRTGFDEGFDEMVIARDIPFFSVCEHHLLPFYGSVTVGYLPNGRVVGISKLARVVDILARRPQLQERLTTQIADTIVEGAAPMGVGVVVQAEHLCMVMRGVKKAGSHIITSVNRGVFRTDARTRTEFLDLSGCRVS